MTNAYVLSGKMSDPTTLQLDEPLPIAASEVRVVIEVVSTDRHPHLETMERIWAGQRARGHVPPTREEVDEWIRSGREDRDEQP